MTKETETGIEQELRSKGLNAKRVTPGLIDATIADEQYHVFPGTQVTVCCLTLRNGFTVMGESAFASPENFDAKFGRKIARENARQKIWALEGYLLKDDMHRLKESGLGVSDSVGVIDTGGAIGGACGIGGIGDVGLMIDDVIRNIKRSQEYADKMIRQKADKEKVAAFDRRQSDDEVENWTNGTPPDSGCSVDGCQTCCEEDCGPTTEDLIEEFIAEMECRGHFATVSLRWMNE